MVAFTLAYIVGDFVNEQYKTNKILKHGKKLKAYLNMDYK